jgi:hypothetical protein
MPIVKLGRAITRPADLAGFVTYSGLGLGVISSGHVVQADGFNGNKPSLVARLPR